MSIQNQTRVIILLRTQISYYCKDPRDFLLIPLFTVWVILDGNVDVVKTKTKLYWILVRYLVSEDEVFVLIVGGWLSDIKMYIEYFNKYPFILSCVMLSGPSMSLIGLNIVSFFF